jgi:hypothetical protein
MGSGSSCPTILDLAIGFEVGALATDFFADTATSFVD